jgi:hypothetical protein
MAGIARPVRRGIPAKGPLAGPEFAVGEIAGITATGQSSWRRPDTARRSAPAHARQKDTVRSEFPLRFSVNGSAPARREDKDEAASRGDRARENSVFGS